jgi:hypothetical protein
MSDIAGRIDGLPPEKRALLARILHQAPARFNAFPLSFAQRRMWFLHRMDPASAVYNVPAAVRVRGALDAEALRRALDEVVRRHEVLRGSYTQVEGEPVQVTAPAAPLDLPWKTSPPSRRKHATRSRCASRTARRARPSTWRAAAAARQAGAAGRGRPPPPRDRAPHRHRRLVGLADVPRAGRALPGVRRRAAVAAAELALQYADFAAWQREHLRGERMDRLAEHWTRRMEGAPALLELPPTVPPPGGHLRRAMLRCELPRRSGRPTGR